LVSGFSPSMLKAFLEDGSADQAQETSWDVVGDDGEVTAEKEVKQMTPTDKMHEALNKQSYSGLQVLD
jgi:hypothetical protein